MIPRWEADNLVTWCSQNNLELNALKKVEMVVDFRFLGTILSQDLRWELNTEHVLPMAAEEIQPAKDNDGALLHSHH